jgi:hypothetical protein
VGGGGTAADGRASRHGAAGGEEPGIGLGCRYRPIEWSEHLYRLFGMDPRQASASVETGRRVLHADDAELVREEDKAADRNSTNPSFFFLARNPTWPNKPF